MFFESLLVMFKRGRLKQERVLQAWTLEAVLIWTLEAGKA